MEATNLLKEYHLKVTPQRVAIVKELHDKGHLNIDDLYHLLKVQFPSISLATIYKNINSMLESFFLSEVKIPHQKSVYELTKTAHSHIVCQQCQTIMDVDLNTQDLIEEAMTKSQFKLENINVVLTGICENCK